ncbi:hypothetical protein M8818_000940 [Zalaria obscura]|uniref:Uncharacterized protein n=1 Tax=Zalaria obscura TaxID=2024903 RepID=A0ACC3SLE0_9PEZI
MRHSILETIPRKSTEGGNGHAPFGITMDRALQMAQQYLLVTNGVLNVLDMDYFHEHLPLWVRDPSHHSEDRSSIFYLVMAIGAQVASDASNQEEAEHYFHHGRQLAFSTFTEAPSIRTVQSYALICIYMLGACRRNGAFMNLGIAVRAAYALGIHKQNTHALFPENERRTRRQVWKAVRFLDLFLSGSLGRPPATYDFGNDAQATSSRASSNATEEESFSAAVSTLCHISLPTPMRAGCVLELHMPTPSASGRARPGWVMGYERYVVSHGWDEIDAQIEYGVDASNGA